MFLPYIENEENCFCKLKRTYFKDYTPPLGNFIVRTPLQTSCGLPNGLPLVEENQVSSFDFFVHCEHSKSVLICVGIFNTKRGMFVDVNFENTLSISVVLSVGNTNNPTNNSETCIQLINLLNSHKSVIL